MKITSVRYGRTKNLGNFESERVDIEIALDASDSYAAAVDLLKGLAAVALGEEPTSDVIDQAIAAGVNVA